MIHKTRTMRHLIRARPELTGTCLCLIGPKLITVLVLFSVASWYKIVSLDRTEHRPLPVHFIGKKLFLPSKTPPIGGQSGFYRMHGTPATKLEG